MDSKFLGPQIGWLVNPNIQGMIPTGRLALYRCDASGTYWTQTHLGYKIRLDIPVTYSNGILGLQTGNVVNVPSYEYYGPFMVITNNPPPKPLCNYHNERCSCNYQKKACGKW